MKYYINILLDICQHNKYLSTYIKLCERTQARIKLKITEKHHILPQCFKLGGYKDKENIAFLTPREHFICHKLLVKCVDDKQLKASLAYATWQMTKRHKINSREYENLKNLLSECYSGIPKSEKHKQSLRKPKSDSSKMGRPKGCSNPFKGVKRPEVGLKISLAKKGKTAGKDNHFFGKQHSDETKEKIKKTMTEKYGETKPWLTSEAIKKRSEKQKGKIPHNAQSVVYKGITYSSIKKCADANGVTKHIMKKLLNATG
jgi:hypothetical protein